MTVVSVDPTPPARLPLSSARLANVSEESYINGHHQINAAPPPLTTNNKKKRRGCCYKCFCCTIFIVIVLIVLLAAIIGIIYLIYKPKFPVYSVDRLRVSNFTLTNSNLSTIFAVSVSAVNTNKKIGIYYKYGSSLTAWYNDSKLLASGSLPEFYQGYRNTTVINTLLSGETELEGKLVGELKQQQKKGSIPLTFLGSVPVRVKLKGLVKLWTLSIKVRCNLVVNSLSSSDISISSSNCKFTGLKIFG